MGCKMLRVGFRPSSRFLCYVSPPCLLRVRAPLCQIHTMNAVAGLSRALDIGGTGYRVSFSTRYAATFRYSFHDYDQLDRSVITGNLVTVHCCCAATSIVTGCSPAFYATCCTGTHPRSTRRAVPALTRVLRDVRYRYSPAFYATCCTGHLLGGGRCAGGCQEAPSRGGDCGATAGFRIWGFRVGTGTLNSIPYTLYPKPYILNPNPYPKA